MGNHGRKGPKQEETVCGTVVEFLALNSKFPVLIIKDYRPRTVKPDGCLRWGVCYDSSTKSIKALRTVLNLMKKLDKLMIIHVHEEDNALSNDVVKQYAEQEAKRFGITKMEVTILDKVPGTSTAQIIKDHLSEKAQNDKIHGYIDFIAVGNGGLKFDKKLG